MRIGFQIEHLDPLRGGAETYVAQFARQLVGAGHEVHVFAAGFANPPAGVITHHVMARGLSRPERDVHFAWSAQRAARRARLDVTVAIGRTFGADVLHPHGGTLLGSRRQNLAMLGSPALRAMKQAFDVLNPRVRTRLWIEGRQFGAEPPPQVVAVSRMVADHARRYHGVHDERLHVVYNGVDLERFSPSACAAARAEGRKAFALRDHETCFLLVAHNLRLKGMRELVRAAADLEVAGGAWRIVVVGRAKPGPYERLARRLGCAHRLLFAGPLDDVLPAYAASDVYVQPSWYDPCSLVVLEAMACGRPVVTTRFNGASELMSEGREGFLLDAPSDVVRLAQTMHELMDADLRRVMGDAARRTAEEHPLERNFKEMMDVFRLVVEQREAEGA